MRIEKIDQRILIATTAAAAKKILWFAFRS